MKIIVEINKIESRKIEKITYIRSPVILKINRTDKPLARVKKKNSEQTSYQLKECKR